MPPLELILPYTGPTGALVVLIYIGWNLLQQKQGKGGHPMSEEERVTLSTILSKLDDAKNEVRKDVNAGLNRLEKRLEDGQKSGKADRDYISKRLDEHIEHHLKQTH